MSFYESKFQVNDMTKIGESALKMSENDKENLKHLNKNEISRQLAQQKPSRISFLSFWLIKCIALNKAKALS
jgi:hypothetical protein